MTRRYNVAALMSDQHCDVMSVAQYRASVAKAASKFGNQKVLIDGRTFDSRLEGRRYEQLKQLQAAGEVDHFLCQVPFWIAPGVRYVVDFMIVWKSRFHSNSADQWVVYEDVKGHLTQTSRTKIKTVEHLYGVQIKILTKAEIGSR